MKNLSRTLWGLALIALGVIIGGNALGLFNIDLFFDGWWTLFIIVPCAIDLITEDHKIGSLIGLLVGVVLLLACQDVVSFGDVWKMILPAALIIIGLSFIFKDVFTHKISSKIKEINEKNGKDAEHCAAFSGQNIECKDEFKGATISAIFGGIKYDLSKAKLKNDQVINCTAIFGGVDVIVPDDVKVEIVSSSMFGGVSDKRKNKGEGAKTLYVNATCIFGGVEIK